MIKFLFTLMAFATLHLSTQARAQTNTVTLSEKIVQLNVEISPTNLKWSEADYSSPVVKVLVPELADVTILDHRNAGEGAPCLATYEARSPEDVIQNNPSVEKIDFQITLQKKLSPNLESQTCDVELIESIEGKIRGFKFVHDRHLSVGSRHIDDCR